MSCLISSPFISRKSKVSTLFELLSCGSSIEIDVFLFAWNEEVLQDGRLGGSPHTSDMQNAEVIRQK